ncbi:DHA2 family efflux MFS transporter permease subunit [Streptomyces sp. NPDC053427]|uniref:DHA2 family efflux MFS transporter permease subunit n=1 Tax=Streptomyces sp. NPDC053427 TaxID=3365701 RepID=UPI0037D6F011
MSAHLHLPSTAAIRATLAGPSGRRRRLAVLGICGLSLFMTYLDNTILNVALPTIQTSLACDLTALQWVMDGYLLVLGSLLLLAGSIGDRLGRRRLFLFGVLVFTVGSALCSVAVNLGTLVAARVVQAMGGAALTPTSLSIVRDVFRDPGERDKALGMWGGIFGVATACGPLAGGLLVSAAGWRSVFWVNIPLGLAALVLARRFVPESRAPRPRRVDPLGQGLIMVFLAALTYTLVQGPRDGWGRPLIVSGFVLAAVALIAFVVAELRQREPMLDLRYFRNMPFTGANVIALLAFIALAGFLLVNTLYLQQERGLSARSAGVALLPATVAIAAGGPLGGWLVARYGTRPPLIAAGLFITAGSAVLLGLSPSTPYVEIAFAYVLLGAGFGLVNPPITSTAVSGMPASQAGVASAVAATARQFGNALGVAILGGLLTIKLGSSTGPHLLSNATHLPWACLCLDGLAVTAVAVFTTGQRPRDGGGAGSVSTTSLEGKRVAGH